MELFDTFALLVKRHLELSFPHLREGALTSEPNGYVIWVDPAADEGDQLATIRKWLSSNRPAGMPMELRIGPAPEGARLLEWPDGWDIFHTPVWSKEAIWYRLKLEFPSIPLTGIHDEPGTLILHCARPLTTEEQVTLRGALRLMGLDEGTRIQPDGEACEAANPDLALTRSSQVKDQALRDLIERDEDEWRTGRQLLLAPGGAAPVPAADQSSRCLLLGTVFPPLDLRNYLCLYDTVLVTLPIAEVERDVFEGLGVTPTELAELTRMGRVKPVLVQPISRYRPSLLRLLLEGSPESLIPPRRVAMLCLQDFLRRNSLAVGLADRSAQRECLATLRTFGQRCPDVRLATMAETLRRWLVDLWLYFGTALNEQGPMAFTVRGAGDLAGQIHQAITGKNALLECMCAGLGVHLAAGLGATLFPEVGFADRERTTVEMSYEAHSELIASLYMGARREGILGYSASLPPLVEGLLTIDSDIPVLDLAQALSATEMREARSLISSILSEGPTAAHIAGVIDAHNKEIQRLRTNRTVLRKFDLLGLGMSFIPVPGALGFGIATWALEQIVLRIGEAVAYARGDNRFLDTVIDYGEGLVTRTRPDSVTIARLRDQIPARQ